MEEDGRALAQANSSFARKLGSADKKTRDKGLALLVLWLSCQQDVGEDELKKIWKGLFYCLWHSDKANVQGDLINKLAGILENLDIDVSLDFYKVFLSTMRREWGGIDRLRLDKFYLLLRQFFVRVLVILQKNNWDEELVGKFMDILVERALLAKDEYPALGVNLHLMDIFLPEIRKMQPLSAGTLRLMLEPCYTTLAKTADKTLLKRVKDCVFEPLLKEAQIFARSNQAGVASEDGSFGPHVISLLVGPRLFELASDETTPQANRKLLYEIHNEFAKLDKLLSVAGIDPTTLNVGGTDTEMGEVNGNEGVRHSARHVGKKDKREQVAIVSSKEGKKRKVKSVPTVDKEAKDSHDLENLEPVASEGKTKKSLKRETVKLQDKPKKGKQTALRDEEDSREETGAELVDMRQKENKADNVVVEKKKKLKKKVLTEVADGQITKQKKKTGSVAVVKSSQVKAVQLGGKLEVTEQKVVITEVAVARDGELVTKSRSAKKSPIPQVTGAAGELSERREAESLMDVSVNDSVISNLEEKFASIAESRSSDLLLGAVSPIRKKRKRGVVVEDSSEPLTENTPSPGSLHSPMPKSNGVDHTPGSHSSKKKKVRFVLKNNIVWKPHNPLPPQSMRTPPSATPRGSALKKGVPAGPIRVTPARKGLGSNSRRRSPSQILSISKQKPSRSPKSLSKGPRFTRRVRKSPSSL